MGLFSSSSAATDPYAGMLSYMQTQAANQANVLGMQQLAFAKEQWGVEQKRMAELDAVNKQVADAQTGAMNFATDAAKEDRARWKSVFLPLQDKFIAKAQDWDSADAQANAATEAKADVANAFSGQRGQQNRALAARGVNPASGAYRGVDAAMRAEEALAGAGAQNNARRGLRREAIGLQGEAINMGAGLPTQVNSSLGLGVNAGSAATGNMIGANNAFLAGTDIMNRGYTGALNATNTAANIYGDVYKGYSNNLNAKNAADAQMLGGIASGVGSLVGMAAGGYLSGGASLAGAGKSIMSYGQARAVSPQAEYPYF